MATVAKPDRDLLRRLVDMDVADGLVLSVYVDLDPSEFAAGPARSSALTSAADEAARVVEEERSELSHEARIALREDVQRIRDYVEDADFDGTHGLAIFAGPGLFEALHLPFAVENAVVLDSSPHVAPLTGQPGGTWCVLLVNRRDARILRGGPDGLEEDGRISDDVPGQHDQGGLSQARYERHIDEEARRHLKRVAEELAERHRRDRFDQLLVGGPEDGYSEFLDLLDHDLHDLLRGRVTVDVESTTTVEVFEAAAPLMREYEQRREGELLRTLQERLGTEGRAAAGLEEVLEGLNEQRVATLLLDADLAIPGAQCPACGWIGAVTEGPCPADGTELERRSDVIEPAVERALAQDAEVVRLRERPELASHGGIAALLRF